MLRTIVIAALAVGCATAETAIPKTAVEVEPGVYKQTEASGKTYTFRKTPFGVVKSLDEAEVRETRRRDGPGCETRIYSDSLRRC